MLLAVKQAEIIKEMIEKEAPGIRAEIITMKTTGDKVLDNKPGEDRREKGCSSKSLTVRLRRAGSTLPYTA